MIKETIKVNYLIREGDGSGDERIAFDLSKFDGWHGKRSWEIDFEERTATFHSFKNNGQVSKTEQCRYAKVNRKAEALLKHRLQIKAATPVDMQQAIKLAKIINDADWDNQPMAIIKTKTSHSKWYQNAGEMNMPSEYVTLVPASVVKEAKKLQAIRHKHQNDDSFDFYKTDYRTEELRVADHDNGNNEFGTISQADYEQLKNNGEIKL